VWGAEFNHSGGLICFSNYLEKRDGKKFDEHTATWNDFAEFTAARRGAMDANEPRPERLCRAWRQIHGRPGSKTRPCLLTMVDYTKT
jgi:hypothetical protein